MFDEVKQTNKQTNKQKTPKTKNLPCWGLQIAPQKVQRQDSINYLGYKICLQWVRS